jgi:signal transduction histidine kinase
MDRDPQSVLPVKVAFIGGGKGCYDILHLLRTYQMTHIKPSVLAVVDPDPQAVGRVYAEQRGIPVLDTYHDLLQRDDLDLIIEMTGRDEVLADINHGKKPGIKVMDHFSALFLWEIIDIQQDRLQLEKKVRELDTMAAIGEISYRLTHRLRNPLMITGGLIRRLMTRVDLPHNIRKRLKHASLHVGKMENVISDICDIVRPLHPHYVLTELSPFFESWCKAAKVEARMAGILFEYDIEERLPAMFVDPSLLRQALWHLIENSFDASVETGGTISLKVMLCWDDLFIRLTDMGSGFEDLPPARALQPFTSTKSGRMGLGLTLCQQIILNHDGTLELFEDAKGGAVVVITLPVRMSRPAPPKEVSFPTYFIPPACPSR